MSKLKTFNVLLTTNGFLRGTVEAVSEEDAIKQAFHLWRTECPCPFEQLNDEELISVTAEEVCP